MLKFLKAEILVKKQKRPAFSFLNLLLILVPLTPVAQYLVLNSGILSQSDILISIGFFIVSSFLIIAFIPWLLGTISSSRLLTSLGLAFCTTLTSMAVLSKQFNWLYRGSLKIQLAFFAILFLLSFLVQQVRGKDKLFIYLAIAVFFLANSAIHIVNKLGTYTQSQQAGINEKMFALVRQKTPVHTPNIYLLIYDSYAPNETLRAYGIDNSKQAKFLEENGFVIYPNIYSTGSATLQTMRAVLQLSQEYSGESRSGVSGDGIVQKALKRQGYKTIGLFEGDYWFKGAGSQYDFSHPTNRMEQYQYFISAILIGEFRFDQEFNSLTHQDFLDIKQDIFNGGQTGRRFIYAHTELPSHSQNSGACLADETEQFINRFERANNEMKADINNIINSDPEAIIVIAGDHGPYLTKNCYTLAGDYRPQEIDRLDIQDRYGTFLAIKWPGETYKSYDQITVVQDIFPVIFSYLYEDPAFSQLKVPPTTYFRFSVSDVYVDNGIIKGGINDGEPLFLGE